MQDNETLQAGTTAQKSDQLTDTISRLWKRRTFIGVVVIVATVLSVVISFLLPETFKSTAVLLPETDKNKIGGTGLSDLASMAGLSLGGEISLVRLYPTIIRSEAVLKNVLLAKYQTKKYRDSVDLVEFWEVTGKSPELKYETGLRLLGEGLDVSQDVKTGVVTMSIETKEPQLSADIVNLVTKELDAYIRTKRTTNASEQRKWIEARLVEVKGDLERSENLLKEFREKNRMVSSSPELSLEQDRLARDAQINSTLYIELKKQYELAKIDEIKNIPLINVMDAGRAAARKESPHRATIVVSVFLLSLFASASYVQLSQQYRRRTQLLAQILRGNAKSVMK